MTKYRAMVGLSLPDGSRVEAGDTFEHHTVGRSIDWLEKQGLAELVAEPVKKPAAKSADKPDKGGK